MMQWIQRILAREEKPWILSPGLSCGSWASPSQSGLQFPHVPKEKAGIHM